MTQENENMFKSAMFGYSKEDVDAYIAKLNGELSRLRGEAETAKADCDRQLEDLRAQIYDNSTVAENRTNEYNSLVEKYNALCSDAEKMRQEIEQKNADIAKKDEEIAALKIMVEQKQQVLGNTLTEAEEKARQYDAVSSKIGALIIKATKDAEEIRGCAEAEAEQLRTEAAEAASVMRADAESSANATRAEAAREAEDYLNEARANITRNAEAANKSIEEYAARTAKSWNSLFYESQLQMATLCNEIKQKIGETGRVGVDEFTAFRDGLIQSVTLMQQKAGEDVSSSAEAASETIQQAVDETGETAEDLDSIIEDMTKAEIEKNDQTEQ
ncbi:MAG: hypothetical protein K6D94_07400 [Clostridiales bacterium]|nr:hypothetical protein [Clostridiales bacterium]